MIEVIQSSLFYELAAILILAGILGFSAMLLRQPLIIAFLIAGILAGPGALGIVGPYDHTIEMLAELGVSLLLFMVGLNLDLTLIRSMGTVAIITGLAQVTLTALAGAAMGLFFGLTPATALFLGIALAFSSTIVVIKLLSDKRALDSLYGRIALGILIIQDFAVILAMVALAALGNGAEEASSGFGQIAVRLVTLVAATILFVRFAAAPITKIVSRSPEMMLIFAISLAATMAGLCHYWDLSKELGGLLAGIALASTPARPAIAARLAPLRDFLLLFFFVHLGAGIDLNGLQDHVLPAAAFSAFVLLGKPLVVMVIMRLMRYRLRTGFMAGTALGQISEFSLIFAAMGASSGFIGQDMVEMITLTGLITIGLSSYVITYSSHLYELFDHALIRTGLRSAGTAEKPEVSTSIVTHGHDIIVFGMGRYGISMALRFRRDGAKVLGVDFDPEAIKNAEESGIPVHYGDAADPDLPKRLPLEGTRAIVFAFQHHVAGPLLADLRLILAKSLREHGFQGQIIATSHFRMEESKLIHHGIDAVLCPYEDAASHGADHVMKILQSEQAAA